MAVAPRNAIYVGDLAEQVNETKLMEIFSSVGPITSIRICRDSSTQRSLGYAYINYNRPEHAEAALKSLNFHYIDGRPCRVMYVNRDPWLRKSGKGNIFVKNLPPNTDSVGLRDLFIEFGEIMSVKVPSKDGKWLNYGFVHFKEEKSAQTAIEKKNGVAIDGHKLSVAPFQPKKERSGSITTNLYVKNFPVEDFGDKELQEMFEKYGEISSLKIERNPDTKVSKGFGYVDFKKPGDAKKALELDGTEVQGKKLYVREFQSKEIRKRLLKEKYEKEKQSRWEKFAGTNLFVKNLPEDVDEKKLNEMFSKFGEIKSSVVKMENGVHRGFGFVNFATQEAATKAVTEMNKKLINNKPLYVGLAQSKEERMRKLQDKYNKQHPMVFAGGAPHLMYQQPFPGRPMYMPTGYMVQRGPARMFNGPTQGMGRMPNQIMPGRRGGRKGQNINYKLTANARNHQQAGMMPMPQQIVVQGNPQFQQVQRQPQMMQQGQMAMRMVPQPAPAQPAQAAQQQAPQTQGQLSLAAQLENLDEEGRRQTLGGLLFPNIKDILEAKGRTEAGKITGMLLDLPDNEILSLIPRQDLLADKVQEALDVLDKESGPLTPAEGPGASVNDDD